MRQGKLWFKEVKKKEKGSEKDRATTRTTTTNTNTESAYTKAYLIFSFLVIENSLIGKV